MCAFVRSNSTTKSLKETIIEKKLNCLELKRSMSFQIAIKHNVFTATTRPIGNVEMIFEFHLSVSSIARSIRRHSLYSKEICIHV